MHLFYQKLCCQETDLLCYGVRILEGTGLVGDVALYDTYHLLLGNRDVGHTDAVADLLNHDGLAVRWIQGFIDVVDKLGIGIVEAIQFQDDMLGQTCCRGRDTTSGCQVDMVIVAHLLDVADFKNSPVQRTIEAIAQFLCHVAQVQVVVGNLTQVDVLAEVGVGGVRGTIENGLCIGQVTIGRLSGRGTSEDGHLKLAACLVLCDSYLC